MRDSEIILIGGGGHCKAVIDVIETKNEFKIAGIVDLPSKIGQKILGYEIIANDNDLPELVGKYKYFFITIGHLSGKSPRLKIFKMIKELGGILPIIISSNAHVSKYSCIDEGSIIMHNTIINADTQIGKNCIINNKALVEHDCKIGNNCHISTNAIVNGGLTIEDNCFIGSNSVTKQCIKIASNTIIGAGAVVTKDITESGVYVGSPAKRYK